MTKTYCGAVDDGTWVCAAVDALCTTLQSAAAYISFLPSSALRLEYMIMGDGDTFLGSVGKAHLRRPSAPLALTVLQRAVSDSVGDGDKSQRTITASPSFATTPHPRHQSPPPRSPHQFHHPLANARLTQTLPLRHTVTPLPPPLPPSLVLISLVHSLITAPISRTFLVVTNWLCSTWSGERKEIFFSVITN